MKKESRQILKINELIFRNITILLLCILIGINLDRYFDTKPVFIIIFSILSLAYLVISLVLLKNNKNTV